MQEVATFIVQLERKDDFARQDEPETYLFGGSRLSLENQIGRFVVLRGHGASEWRLILSIAYGQIQSRSANEQVDDRRVLIDDGNMEWRVRFGILNVIGKFNDEKDEHERAERNLFIDVGMMFNQR